MSNLSPSNLFLKLKRGRGAVVENERGHAIFFSFNRGVTLLTFCAIALVHFSRTTSVHLSLAQAPPSPWLF